MQNEKRERLIQLAEQIAVEQDPEKFRALIVELNNLLEEKENRLQGQADTPTKPSVK